MSRKPLKSRELAYLEVYGAKELDSETVQAIVDKRIWLEDEPLYVRKKIAGGGEIDLLTANLDEAVGITNIDKRTLPKFVHFILSAIQFEYGYSAVGNNSDAVDIQYTSITANLPVALQHANLIVKQNDTPIITMPIKLLTQAEKSREFEGDQGLELKYCRIIKAGIPFQISIKFPDDEALEAVVNHHFVTIWLKGSKTRLRGVQ